MLASSLNYEETLRSIARLIVGHVAEWCIVDILEDGTRVQRLTVAHADPAKASICEHLAALLLDSRHILAQSVLEARQPQLYDDLTPELVESIAKDRPHVGRPGVGKIGARRPRSGRRSDSASRSCSIGALSLV